MKDFIWLQQLAFLIWQQIMDGALRIIKFMPDPILPPRAITMVPELHPLRHWAAADDSGLRVMRRLLHGQLPSRQHHITLSATACNGAMD
jgi:hypothetical protein